jgi:hypothetical protein
MTTGLAPFRIVVLVGTALALVVAAAWWLRRRRRRPVVYPPAAEPCPERPAAGTRAAEILAMFGELRPGNALDGWRIVGLFEDDRGCAPVLLADAGGAELRIDVLRRDAGSPVPPAETEKLAFYVSGMRAGSITPDDCVRAARALAAALAAIDREPPAWLLTMRERAEVLRRGRRGP